MNMVTGGDTKRGYDEGLSWGGKRLQFGERFSALGYKNTEGLSIQFQFSNHQASCCVQRLTREASMPTQSQID